MMSIEMIQRERPFEQRARVNQQYIWTANDTLHIEVNNGYRRFVHEHANRLWKGVKLYWQIRGEPVYAKIVRNQWVADCGECQGSIIIEPGQPFMCIECLNTSNGHYARPILWPDDRSRLQIESILLGRYQYINRNWEPGETIEMLIAENIEHGQPVPVAGGQR